MLAVLGAESTGKTTLALALAQHLAEQGTHVAVVDETLRSLCHELGRTPHQHEQVALAARHAARIEAAAAAHEVVIADTTGLQTAVYSEWVFGDRTLYPAETRWHREHVDLTLLTALDLPWVADGIMRDGPQVREPIDAMLRRSLADAGIVHAVIGGTGERRLQAALAAWQAVSRGPASQAAAPQSPEDQPERRQRWRTWCEDCDDPDCEQRSHRR